MKPILFNTEMVKALLDGRKTVTRRVVKPQAKGRPVPMGNNSCWPGYFAIQGTENVICPPYHPSDILWVRETFAQPAAQIFWYRADSPVQAILWRPSIHMPREAARIFLRVTGVRAERLKDITAIQAMDEGFTDWNDFVKLWDSTIKPADRSRYGWHANPWVWVIEFERISKEEALKDGKCDKAD